MNIFEQVKMIKSGSSELEMFEFVKDGMNARIIGDLLKRGKTDAAKSIYGSRVKAGKIKALSKRSKQ